MANYWIWNKTNWFWMSNTAVLAHVNGTCQQKKANVKMEYVYFNNSIHAQLKAKRFIPQSEVLLQFYEVDGEGHKNCQCLYYGGDCVNRHRQSKSKEKKCDQ